MLTSTSLGLTILLATAFIVNLPLGWLRQGTARYSWRWFLYIHLSIPLIIALRLALNFSWQLIPLTILCAIVGQLLGGQLQRRCRP